MPELKGRNSVKEQVKQSRVSTTGYCLMIVERLVLSFLTDMQQTYTFKTNRMVKYLLEVGVNLVEWRYY